MVENVFITAVNIKDWSRSKTLKPNDKIIAILCFTRFFLGCSFFLEPIGIWMAQIPLSDYTSRCFFYFSQLFIDFFSRWLSMWLSFLYFIKITIFKNPIILNLQSLVPRMTGYVVILSLIVAFIPGMIYSFSRQEGFCISNTAINTTVEPVPQFFVIAFFFGHCLPSTLETISSIYLFRTLFTHVKNTKTNVSSYSSPNMAAHWSVIRYILLLNFTSMCNFLGNSLLWFSIDNPYGGFMGYILAFTYPTLHSFIIILCNSKLKNEMVNVLDYTKKWFSINKHSDNTLETVTQ
ncbi:hypothetical protein GDO86_010630 [Hymenochirus boettgeri]|uniref:Taste receptor type 2 n=1 Tax=Hymenochirus boettgeri TaxID=247094 RepID=A0A8T2JU57_9PIPI|nr:hypothetical protein GDO86_010630 [Hymenochirus boettgeri]